MTYVVLRVPGFETPVAVCLDGDEEEASEAGCVVLPESYTREVVHEQLQAVDAVLSVLGGTVISRRAAARDDAARARQIEAQEAREAKQRAIRAKQRPGPDTGEDRRTERRGAGTAPRCRGASAENGDAEQLGLKLG